MSGPRIARCMGYTRTGREALFHKWNAKGVCLNCGLTMARARALAKVNAEGKTE